MPKVIIPNPEVAQFVKIDTEGEAINFVPYGREVNSDVVNVSEKASY